MKDKLITSFLLLIAVAGFSQAEQAPDVDSVFKIQKEVKQKYHRARIFYGSPSGLVALANQGVAVDHGNNKPGVYIESDFSDNDIGIARIMDMTVEILIEDVSAYYKSRNAKDQLDGMKPPLKNAGCASGISTTYATPNNWS